MDVLGYFTDGWKIVFFIFLLAIPISIIGIYLKTKTKFKVSSAGNNDESVFHDAVFIGDELRQWLEQHYKRTKPVLLVWQKRAWFYGRIHYFVVLWTTIISLCLPFTIQYASKNPYAMILVQGATAFSAIIFGLHSVFKVHSNFQKYRLFESAVYTHIRHIKDNPYIYGQTDEERRIKYSEAIEKIREEARSNEIDNLPNPVSVNKEVKL